MRKVIAFTLAVGLSGCGWVAEIGAHATGYSRVCVDHVRYVQFPSGVSVEYQPDGKLKGC